MRNTERDRERLVVSRRPDDVTSPFRSRAPPGEEQEAQQFHKTERSQRAQTLDERRNAPLAEDVEEWKENPGRLDFPRVDTVQADDLELRAKTVAQKATSVDLLSGVERDGGIEPRGEFDPETKRARVKPIGSGDDGDGEGFVDDFFGRRVAHETGHAIEDGPGFSGDDLMNDETLRQQAEGLSERVRGSFASEPSRERRLYRRQSEELFADAASSAMLEPSAAKREAPDLFEELNELAEDTIDAGFDSLI